MNSTPSLRYFFSVALVLLFLTHLFSCSSEKEFTIKGNVQEIQFGKDGYTATVRSADGVYDAVISRVTLGDAYKELHVGDIVTLSGDTLKLNDRTQVMVHKISF